MQYPEVLDPELVGTYEAAAMAGGGYVWDAVLEYRVWCSLQSGAPDECEGNDYYYPFANYDEAFEFSKQTVGAGEPLALILQREHLSEPEPGKYVHVKEQRVAEWPVEFLARPRRTDRTIPNFLAPDAPPNRLEILRGVGA
jgi:putative acetyltransferase